MRARAILRLLLLAAMLLAPLGRIGIAQAMTMPASAGAAMTDHCAGMSAAAPDQHKAVHHRDAAQRERIDCMIACVAMAPAPAPIMAPPPAAATMPGTLRLASLTGIRPEADPPPPRRS